MISLDIISDPVCPWCLIGKRRLDAALAGRPDHPFRVTWRPFRLNPEMPEGGMDRAAYYAAKFGGAEGARRIVERIEAAAAEAGIALRLDRIRRQPQTLSAHILLRAARGRPAEDALAEELFDRFFLRGEDIGARAVLLDAAEAAGLGRAEAEAALGDARLREETLAEEAEARALGVSGVPTFVLGGRQAVSGAQPEDIWTRVIDELGRPAAG